MDHKNDQSVQNIIVEDFESEISALLGTATSLGSCTYHPPVGQDS